MASKLNWEELKNHFGKRLEFEDQYERFNENYQDVYNLWKGVYWFKIDGEYIGYFDSYGKMSYIGPHIELGPVISWKYFKLNGSSTLKRYLTNTGFIKFIETKWVSGDDE